MDTTLRNLERRAATGDIDAALRLARYRDSLRTYVAFIDFYNETQEDNSKFGILQFPKLDPDYFGYGPMVGRTGTDRPEYLQRSRAWQEGFDWEWVSFDLIDFLRGYANDR